MIWKYLCLSLIVTAGCLFLVGLITPQIEPVSYASADFSSFLYSLNSPYFKPLRRWEIAEPEPSAQASLIYLPEKQRILFAQNAHLILPIASLTKLLTAIIAEQALDPKQNIPSKRAANNDNEFNRLPLNQTFSARALIQAMLIQSSNDAAFSLSQQIPDFYEQARQKLAQLKLTSWQLADSSGLNSQTQASALDIARLTAFLLAHDYPISSQALQTAQAAIQSQEGTTVHLLNTNSLLGANNIIAGKTGFTQEAGECLMVISPMPDSGQLIITIVLNAQNRFQETEKLINWAKNAYIW